jgi:hypothetical protein
MYRIPLLPQPSGNDTNQKPLDKPEPHHMAMPRGGVLGFFGRLEDRIVVISFVLRVKGANVKEAAFKWSLI